jgi:hypothetical protein
MVTLLTLIMVVLVPICGPQFGIGCAGRMGWGCCWGARTWAAPRTGSLLVSHIGGLEELWYPTLFANCAKRMGHPLLWGNRLPDSVVSHPFRKVREMDGARGFCVSLENIIKNIDRSAGVDARTTAGQETGATPFI